MLNHTVSPSSSDAPAVTLVDPERSLVPAKLRSAVMVRTMVGTRQLRLTIRARDAVIARATLERDGRTIATRTWPLGEGAGLVKLSVPDSAEGGAAELHVTLADSAGHTRTYERTLALAA